MENKDSWAVVELMGHITLAGCITKPGEYGGLWQVDIPDGDSFRSEFFGSQSVYRIRMVSEEIARAYTNSSRQVISYDAPIVTCEQHEQVIYALQSKIQELRQKLLPAGDFWDDEKQQEIAELEGDGEDETCD